MPINVKLPKDSLVSYYTIFFLIIYFKKLLRGDGGLWCKYMFCLESNVVSLNPNPSFSRENWVIKQRSGTEKCIQLSQDNKK